MEHQSLGQVQGADEGQKPHLIQPAYLFVAAFVIYTLLLLWLAWPMSFLSDDWQLINPDSFSISKLFAANWHGVAGQGGFYRPLVMLSLHLNSLISDLYPASFHTANVLLHALCAAAVFFLYREIISEQNKWACGLAAFLFLVLPIHTDSVFWIAGRTDTICALFFFLTIIYYNRYLSNPTAVLLIIVTLFFWCALLSKEMAMSLPAVLIIIALYKKKLFKKTTLFMLLFILISYAAYFVIRLRVLGSFLDSPANTNISLSRIYQTVSGALQSVFAASIYYNNIDIGIGVVLLTVLIVLFSLKNLRILRDLFFVCAMLLITLVPVVGLVTRWYLYIPSAFACLIVAKVWLQSWRRKLVQSTVFVASAALLVFYGAILIREGFRWRTASKISESTLEQVLTNLTDQQGRVFIINVPSAYLPVGTMWEKPIFAYNLDLALAIKSGRNLRASPVVVNHLLVRSDQYRISSIRRIGRLDFVTECNQFGMFSFHSPDFVSGRLIPVNTKVNTEWGRLDIISPHKLVIRISPYAGEKILFFDGMSWHSSTNQ